MAARLVDFYEQVAKEFGAEGRMQLAMLTCISSVKAEKEADSPENIQKFQQAVDKLKQTLKRKPA